jgi:hypothetical protein
MNTTATLFSLIVGMHPQPMPDMPHCYVAVCNQPFYQQVQSRCETDGVTVYWKDIKSVCVAPTVTQAPEPAVHENINDYQRNL